MPAQTINQACASGLQAVALGAQAILLGQSTIVLAGGIESMSRMPYLVDSEDARWGHKMGNFTLVDAMYRDGFFVPAVAAHHGRRPPRCWRGSTASRAKSPMRSRSRASSSAEAAIAAGRFDDEITPAPGRDAKGKPVELDVDEHPRAGATIEGLRKLPLVFAPVDGQAGIITAGSSSGITDGGAAVVLRQRGRSGPPRPDAARAHRRLGDGRRRSAHHGHRAGAGGAQAAGADRARRSTTSISSS